MIFNYFTIVISIFEKKIPVMFELKIAFSSIETKILENLKITIFTLKSSHKLRCLTDLFKILRGIGILNLHTNQGRQNSSPLISRYKKPSVPHSV